MIRQSVFITLAAMALAGCAHRAMPPLAADDPANPNAPEAPLPPVSQTLMVQGNAAPVNPPAQEPMQGMHMHGMNMDSMPHGQGGDK